MKHTRIMRSSLVLGIVGIIFGFLGAFIMVGLVGLGEFLGVDMTTIGSLYMQATVAFIGPILGFVGGVIGKKIGGILMIIAALAVVIAISLYGLLTFILFLVGGILALREKS